MALDVEIKDFSYRYASHLPKILEGISLTVSAGSCCAVLGPTGAGKSTLLYALSGILGKHHKSSLSSGTIRIGSERYTPLPLSIRFPEVMMATQESHTQISGFHETVVEEISFTLTNLGLTKEAITLRVLSTMKELGILHLQGRKVTQLSGGEIQRVGLATILVVQPSLLLLDEPTNSLDNTAKQQVKQIVRSYKGKTTVLFTDYDIELALAVANKVIIMDQGKIVFANDRSSFLHELHRFNHILPIAEWSNVLNTIRMNCTSSPRFARIAQWLNLS